MPKMIATSIISLTSAGRQLAERLCQWLTTQDIERTLPHAKPTVPEPLVIHLHRPKPFGETVRAHYRAGRRLIFIAASGIAVRTLAPALCDKHRDPAVLVLDESGQFVIPLLSGHEGGGNEWARQVAKHLQAHCAITSAAHYLHPHYAVGIGCDRGCPDRLIEALATASLRDLGHGIDLDDVEQVASIDRKADEVGLLAWTQRHQLPLRFYRAEQLHHYEDQLSYRSQHVFNATGCYGVAEAAALAAAASLTGNTAELVIPKQKNARATFALARSYPAPERADSPSALVR